MSRRACTASVLALSVLVCQLPAGANGVVVPPSHPAAAARTPEGMAVEAYNKGLDSRKRGVKAEEQAAKSARAPDRIKHQKKAQEEFQRALKNFKDAARLNPGLP